MRPSGSLTTAEVLAVFADEIAAHEGSVTDTFDDGTRLFTRSVLPRVEEVRPRDRVQGGVALRASGPEVWLHPYVFRLVCRNGAIMAQATQTRHLTDLHLLDPEEAETAIREAVRACCAVEAFTVAAEQMRSAQEIQADLALSVLPMLARHSSQAGSNLLAEVVARFFGEGDMSRFGLMNAITSVARDTRDPEARWGLEELGGAVPAGLPPTPSRDPAAVAHRGREVMIG
jgi:hypothetical protein